MRWGIPLIADRVAPRCTCADTLLLATVSGGRVVSCTRMDLTVGSAVELVAALGQHGVETVVCGGVGPDVRETLDGQGIAVIDNVAGSAEEVITALDRGELHSGYGLSDHRVSGPSHTADGRARTGALDLWEGIDCLACKERICLLGRDCLPATAPPHISTTPEQNEWLAAATDIVREEERKLCRLAELVYFCLEMKFRRVGLAYCDDLTEPARILAGVLARFFEVVPVCCKVGGDAASDAPGMPCNPLRQAEILNASRTDLNVTAGLCIGADCVFNRASLAPVTALFVKDRSLANNPIGAVYSEYYLRESANPSPAGRPATGERRREALPGERSTTGHEEARS
jgi:uncharacterized metal-binding protein/predicted Fe-Mo cluster-binding NifX family protein